MTYLKTILTAAAILFGAPALAHDGVHIEGAYARSTGGIGGSGAIFLTVRNHQIEDDHLLGVASDVAEMVQLHTHIAGPDGVMQMRETPEGTVIPANDVYEMMRGGDHIMLMGLRRKLRDGDMITLTLTFENVGDVTVEVPVDNARKEAAMDHSAHMNANDDMMSPEN